MVNVSPPGKCPTYSCVPVSKQPQVLAQDWRADPCTREAPPACPPPGTLVKSQPNKGRYCYSFECVVPATRPPLVRPPKPPPSPTSATPIPINVVMPQPPTVGPAPPPSRLPVKKDNTMLLVGLGVAVKLLLF